MGYLIWTVWNSKRLQITQVTWGQVEHTLVYPYNEVLCKEGGEGGKERGNPYILTWKHFQIIVSLIKIKLKKKNQSTSLCVICYLLCRMGWGGVRMCVYIYLYFQKEHGKSGRKYTHYLSDRGLVSSIYEVLLKLNNKENAI